MGIGMHASYDRDVAFHTRQTTMAPGILYGLNPTRPTTIQWSESIQVTVLAPTTSMDPTGRSLEE